MYIHTPYPLTSRLRIQDTTVIQLLKLDTGLPFYAVRDENYRVDAILELRDIKSEYAAGSFQQRIQAGHFLTASCGKKLFVLPAINLPEEEKKIRTILSLSVFHAAHKMPAKISFVNADLKLTADGQVKILEFGRGMQSGFLGLQVATGQNIVDLLQRRFAEEGLPPLILTSIPGVEKDDKEKLTKGLKNCVPRVVERPDELKSYRAIYGGYHTVLAAPDVLPLDDPSTSVIFENKALTHAMFERAERLDLRPKTLIFDAPESKTDIDRIIGKIFDTFPDAGSLVLKIPNMERGEGVIIMSKKELNNELPILLSENLLNSDLIFTTLEECDPLEECDQRLDKIKKNNLWVSGLLNINYFMVEEYVTNKHINYNSLTYDATMRVALLMIRDLVKVSVIPFACYWKLPPKPVGDGELREHTVSSFSQTHHNACRVASADEILVYDILIKRLPAVVSQLFNFDMDLYFRSLKHNSELEKKKKIYTALTGANVYYRVGLFPLSAYYLEQARALDPRNFRIDYEAGIMRYEEGQYEEAIQYFTRVLEAQPTMIPAYFRRGCAYLKLGKVRPAKVDFYKVFEGDTREYTLKLQKYIKNFFSEKQTLAISLIEAKQFQRAIEVLTMAIELVPDRASLYCLRAICFKDLLKKEQALNDFNQAIKFAIKDQDNTLLSKIYYERGLFLFYENNKVEAKNDFDKATAIEPGLKPEINQFLKHHTA